MTDNPTGVAPIAVNFMLACYVTPIPAEHLGHAVWNSGAGLETRKWLQDNGLINEDNRATKRGEAWVEYICATPLPVARWGLPERAR
jgi:hypothetical protein